ncbi:radical SAM protein [Cytophagaceae bacterium YF14B1]|uniref:Radical SAM protein n=1 Tax=Xanthocytophaga flava TaxID=3048013 RepID=A0AAE3QUB1_9BACT|nr:radical SAM protein [Xanthocytophaga flavus]MDJ1485610.1 radical SAM protein [Xanthocytophaga flavus]
MKKQPKCRSLILKVASRCNLNCSYCYMYNAGDSTYQYQPAAMSKQIVEAVLIKVKAHCKKHKLKHFDFIFHGGEPLLLPKQFYIDFVAKADETLRPEIIPHYSLQTNGTLLSVEWCKLLASLNIRLGVSLDGTAETNDRVRVDHRGKGSYHRIVKGLNTALQTSSYGFRPGLLCVIDPTSDPIATYNQLKNLSDTISFLLPYATYEHPPKDLTKSATPYADWLIAIYDQWIQQSHKPQIRIFQQIMELILGIDRGFEYLGSTKNEFLVIETDGGIEAAGALKVCGEGFTKAGMNILSDQLDDALQTDLIQLYYLSHHRLSRKCRLCSIKKICGGGYLPHRFRKKNGFDNPSVFCQDLMRLIAHIQNSLISMLSEEIVKQSGLIPLDYSLLKAYADLDV